MKEFGVDALNASPDSLERALLGGVPANAALNPEHGPCERQTAAAPSHPSPDPRA